MIASLVLAIPGPTVRTKGAGTIFTCHVGDAGRLHFRIFDAGDRLVRRLSDGFFAAGVHVMPWACRDERDRPLPSGLYFYHLEDEQGRSRRGRIAIVH